MTQWDARASAILHEHATNVAVYSIAVSMVFWLASQVKKHCCAQQESVPAAQSKGSRNRSSKHTHWTRRVPGKYTYLTWGMAVISASLCASTKQADFLFAVNLCSCIFACQAQRALARARLRSGWIRKARRVGKARVKARRQPGAARSRLQMLIVALFLFSPASWVCVEGVCQGTSAAVQPVRNAWSTARKLRNRLMRAMHGNTMKKAHSRQAEASTPSQCIDMSAGSNHGASKTAKLADAVDAASSVRAQSRNPSCPKELEEDEDRKLAVRVQTRIGCELIRIPGDGWCFFHAVLRHCRGWQSWSIPEAAKLYLQALEWMCKQKHGPRADEVAIASVPFDDREAGLHLGFLEQAEQLEAAEGLTAADIVLWSKVVAVLEKPRMLDSIHHGSVVELWALTQAFDFHCLIWSQEDNKNIWIQDMAYITDAETQQKLQEHSNVLELFHRNTGITGHYDLVQRAAALREPFPETPWLETWRTESAEAVLCLAAESLRNPVEVSPMSLQSHSSQPSNPISQKEVEEDEDRKLAVRVQTRIGCELIRIPGDGWCFFHAVLRHCRGWHSWSIPEAAKLYLQALEWMCKQKHGPRADEVAIASVPFDDREAGLHLGFLEQAEQLEAAEGLTAADIVLWSKVVAVLEKPRMLDSIHHGSVVELWALTQAFDFHCLIWSQEDDKNIWIREMAYITDAETQQKLQEHSNVLELCHRNTGITGHYDLVQRAEALREPFPETPWLETWRTESAEAVLCLAAESLRNPVEASPMSLHSHSSQVEEQRAKIENDATEEAEAESPTVRPARQPQPTSRITATESDATPFEPNRPQQVHDTTAADKAAATGVWEGHDDAEASEGAATDLDSESVLSWDSNLSETTEEAEVEVTVDSTKTWVTVEDRDQERIRRTASHLRQHSLLPSPAAMTEFPTMQPNSGLVYPAVHCAFEGCGWASDTQPCHPHWSKEKVWNMKATTWAHTPLKCCGNEVGCLWAHLEVCHSEHFADIPREFVASTYTAALLEKERGQVPQVGWSVDRRTLRRLRVDLDDNTCQALICACCARVSPGGMGGEIAYISVKHLFNTLTPDAIRKLEQGQVHDAIWYAGCCDKSVRCTGVDSNPAGNDL